MVLAEVLSARKWSPIEALIAVLSTALDLPQSVKISSVKELFAAPLAEDVHSVEVRFVAVHSVVDQFAAYQAVVDQFVGFAVANKPLLIA